MTRAKALLVCDDPEGGRVWSYALGQIGLEVTVVGSSEQALDQCTKQTFTLLIIDVSASQLDGVDLCRRLRGEAVNPILLLTPKTDETHALEAYRAGADECIPKPVSRSLLLAKVKTWLRHSQLVPTAALSTLQAGDLLLDPATREVAWPTGAVVRLTNLEFRVLHLLMSHRGRVLDPDLIIDRVWGYGGGGDRVLLKNVVYRLRRKVERDPRQPRYVQTVAGEGYTFQPD